MCSGELYERNCGNDGKYRSLAFFSLSPSLHIVAQHHKNTHLFVLYIQQVLRMPHGGKYHVSCIEISFYIRHFPRRVWESLRCNFIKYILILTRKVSLE